MPARLPSPGLSMREILVEYLRLRADAQSSYPSTGVCNRATKSHTPAAFNDVYNSANPYPVFRLFVTATMRYGSGLHLAAVCNHRPGGEIGRRTGLKIPGRKACGFDSRPGHHRKSYALTVRHNQLPELGRRFWATPVADCLKGRTARVTPKRFGQDNSCVDGRQQRIGQSVTFPALCESRRRSYRVSDSTASPVAVALSDEATNSPRYSISAASLTRFISVVSTWVDC